MAKKSNSRVVNTILPEYFKNDYSGDETVPLLSHVVEGPHGWQAPPSFYEEPADKVSGLPGKGSKKK